MSLGRFWGKLSLDGVPVVRQKLSDPCDGMGSDAGKDVLKPGEGFDTNPLARGREAPQNRSRFAALVAAEEHPVIASNRHAADIALGGIIIDAQIAVFAVAIQRRPVLQGITHRTPLRTLRQYLRLDLQQVVIQLI